MNKICNFSIIVLLAVTLFSCGSNKADKTENKDLVAAPVETEQISFEEQDYHIPNELKYVKQKFDFLYNKFRPIGWSADGKFAYVVEPADEACGCYFFSFFIQDMKSDKILYEFKLNDEGAGKSLSSVWDENLDVFSQELVKYKIIQKKPVKLQNREFTVNKSTFVADLKTEMVEDKDFNIELVKNTQVFLKKDGKTKQLLNRESEQYDALLNVTLPGIVASPYEERIAVVLQEERRGYEGPPNVLSFRLVGASLTNGF